jgi:plastocyanin
VHGAAIALLPVLAAEKSKVPFYVAGGALACWAVIVSVGLGLRKPDFPGGPTGQRIVIAITAVLVLAAVSMAVVTSGSPAKKGLASAASTSPAAGAAPAAPAQTASTPAPGTPAATTGTPAPASSPAHKGSPSAIALAADPAGSLSYTTKQISAKAGSVTITFSNASPVEHNVTIARGSTVLGATPTFTGGSKALTLTLQPGTYTFYCTVPGHRQAGMEGTLSVT